MAKFTSLFHKLPTSDSVCIKTFRYKSRESTYCLMNCTASSYFIPLSMRAKATKTGALRGKEIQWTSSRRQWENQRRREVEQNIKCQGWRGPIVICWREREGGRNLGNGPGKSTGVHKFTVALLGHSGHTLSLTHRRTHTNCDKLQ